MGIVTKIKKLRFREKGLGGDFNGYSYNSFLSSGINGIMGGIVLFLFNLVGGIFNLYLEISPLNAIIVGFLGVPGVILLLIVQMIL